MPIFHAIVRRAAQVALAAAALAGCDGTAVVTLTASQAHFLAYRVTLVSVALQASNGAGTVQVLPAGTTIDLARLSDVDQILGAAAAVPGTYTSAVVTVDYSNSLIVADDGSAAGATLTAVDASGMPLGRVALTVNLDPKDALRVDVGRTSSLALDMKLSASNAVNLAQKTDVVTPMIAASTVPLDAKPVRVGGAIASVDATKATYTVNVAPYGSTMRSAGSWVATPDGATAYEVNGVPAQGAVGFAALAGVGAGAYTVAIGAFSGTATASSATQNVLFTPTDVYAGSSAASARFDRLSGLVTARAGDSLTVSGATLLSTAGTNSFVTGIGTVTLSTSTAVTHAGQANPLTAGLAQQISVGSRITAFGTATTDAAGNVTLDAGVGRIRIAPSTADGIVSALGNGTVTVALDTLGGRAVAPFAFAGTGASADSNPARYQIATTTFSLANASVGTPVEASGNVANFGAAPPDFIASSLADRTNLPAVLSIDWGSAGTAAPFVSIGSAQLDLDRLNAAIGARHQILIGAQSLDMTTLASDPLIVPDGAATAVVYSIGHATSATVDNYDSFADFSAALGVDLNGAVHATALTADGVFNASTDTLSATSVSVYLDD